uniref:(northern house mosquito) hypothetical protein n=1 Tax=Culex pipiens TaxID=7175 RepID=A0A8D8GD45_CULPI
MGDLVSLAKLAKGILLSSQPSLVTMNPNIATRFSFCWYGTPEMINSFTFSTRPIDAFARSTSCRTPETESASRSILLPHSVLNAARESSSPSILLSRSCLKLSSLASILLHKSSIDMIESGSLSLLGRLFMLPSKRELTESDRPAREETDMERVIRQFMCITVGQFLRASLGMVFRRS